jgi:CRP-like cAMP-binding protein
LRGNQLLAALPGPDFERLARHLEVVTLDLKEPLYEPGGEITHAHFPVSAVCSMVVILEDGTEVELGTVGREGMLGLPLLLGADSMPSMAFTQVRGEAALIPAAAFHEELRRSDALDRLLRRYTLALFNQVAQSAVCNRMHTIEERCARWLLMTHDRVGRDEFPLTHEFLANMLGVRRAGVTVAAGMLMKAGLIRYIRGRMTITDRRGLEEAACECYEIIRKESMRLIKAP